MMTDDIDTNTNNDVDADTHQNSENQKADELEAALSYYGDMLEKAQAEEDYPNVVIALQQMAAVYHTHGNDDDAHDYYRQALEIAEDVDDKEGTAGSLAQLGALLFKRQEFSEALRHVVRAFVIYKELDSPNVRQLNEVVNMIRSRVPKHVFTHVLSQYQLQADEFVRPQNEDANLFLNNIIILTKSAVDARNRGEADDQLIHNLESASAQLPNASEARGFRAYFNMLLEYARGNDITTDDIPAELMIIFDKVSAS